MKVTGLILMIIGLIGGAICVAQMVQPVGADRDGQVPVASESGFPSLVIPLVLCGAAVVAGLLMLMFGGRGYIISYNPKVRN